MWFQLPASNTDQRFWPTALWRIGGNANFVCCRLNASGRKASSLPRSDTGIQSWLPLRSASRSSLAPSASSSFVLLAGTGSHTRGSASAWPVPSKSSANCVRLLGSARGGTLKPRSP